MPKKTIRDMDVTDRRILVRVDFNVPTDSERNITDDNRIRESLPTIRYLLDHGAKVILISHLGRPKGKVVDELRLDKVTERLSQLLGVEVRKTEDSIGPSAKSAVGELKSGELILLENIRFYPEEEKNDRDFARSLSELGDIFVLDAFGTAHRAHASTVGLAEFLPAVTGFLMEKELRIMGQALDNPERPFVAVIGGAKVSDKIGVIENLISKTDFLLIGGGMANTFFKAQGLSVGSSLLEEDKVGIAETILAKALSVDKEIYLPVDVVIAEQIANDVAVRTVDANKIPEGWMALDIGPRTRDIFADILAKARTIIWNGPMGVFEMSSFAEGTQAIIRAVVAANAVSIVGGGDSAAAIEQSGLAASVTHISTGGGASLEFMEGKTLPGVAALLDQ